jgi:hypothetical protein
LLQQILRNFTLLQFSMNMMNTRGRSAGSVNEGTLDESQSIGVDETADDIDICQVEPMNPPAEWGEIPTRTMVLKMANHPKDDGKCLIPSSYGRGANWKWEDQNTKTKQKIITAWYNVNSDVRTAMLNDALRKHGLSLEVPEGGSNWNMDDWGRLINFFMKN